MKNPNRKLKKVPAKFLHLTRRLMEMYNLDLDKSAIDRINTKIILSKMNDKNIIAIDNDVMVMLEYLDFDSVLFRKKMARLSVYHTGDETMLDKAFKDVLNKAMGLFTRKITEFK